MLELPRHSRSFGTRLTLVLTSVLGMAAVCYAVDEKADEKPTAQQLEFFEVNVRPLLSDHCYSCHSASAKKVQGGLLVDSRTGLLGGGDSGPALVPHDVEGSLLIQAVEYESFEMPPTGKLGKDQIQTLRRWVEMGAPWPEESVVHQDAAASGFDLVKRKAEHWVWQPILSPATPEVVDSGWPRQPLDHFVLAQLDEAGLRPAVDADRNALVRRLYFDLIGLPPTAEQTQAFLNDSRPDAYERLIDQLLGSPHFGERWGRHWLDLVRYAESRGHEFDNDSPNAYQYRDYVIRAFNADVPYDQFVREQIAGDLLDRPRLNPDAGFNESILGTGFWFLGEWAHSPVDIRKDETDRFDNMIDVMSKTFLGMTVACARCHDHKFDAISTADYYSLCGFLQSSDYRQVPFESLEHNRQIAQQLAELDSDYRQKIEAILGEAPELPIFQWEPIGLTIAYDGTADWIQDGFVFGAGPRRAGDVYVDQADGQACIRFITRNAAVSDSFWDGLTSLSEPPVQAKDALRNLPRSGRTLRTPTFTVQDGKVACRVRGSGHVVACVDSHRLVAGPLHQETVQPITPDLEWVELNLDRYVGHRLHLEFTPKYNTQLEVSLVVQGALAEARAELERRERLVEKAVEHHSRAVTQRLSNDGQLRSRIQSLVESWAQQRTALQGSVQRESHVAMAMMDGTGEDDRVLIRGSSSNPGKLEPRHFLTAIAGDRPMAIESGSGRRELAAQINADNNPLTSRVIVNRIWHWLLGRGIVPTTDDFGVLGQRPTDPALLDHLAERFIMDGRSIKRMIRYILLSRTYQMSSHLNGHASSVDPKNLLWHHRPPKRLEGEVIRDALLVVAGSLDRTMFGESVPVHLTNFMDGRGRPATSGPLDGERRRSIYIAVRRNFLSPFMLTFDTPTPFSTMGRRNVSNVPAQALILMNDPFVEEQTTRWATQTLRTIPPVTDSPQADDRVGHMYLTAFARLPTQQEREAATEFLTAQAAVLGTDLDHHGIWAALAHALANTKEFIFLR